MHITPQVTTGVFARLTLVLAALLALSMGGLAHSQSVSQIPSLYGGPPNNSFKPTEYAPTSPQGGASTSGLLPISPASPTGLPLQPDNAADQDSALVGIPASPAAAASPTTPVDAASRKRTAMRAPARHEAPTQFQKFVQESTGKWLPHFGSQLFESTQTYGADAGLAAPGNYILGPGDEVRLRVWGAVDINTNLTLDRNGQVSLPKVGVVTLAGVPMAELDGVLRAQMGKVFTNINVSAALGRLRSIQVYVVGQARQPGAYIVSSLSTLVNALFVSGGPSANGSMRSIQLQRGGKTVTTFDLYDFIAKGDKTRDAALLAGDVIFIPPAGGRIALAGAVDQAAIFELKGPAITLADVLLLGGGASPLASTRKALLERVDPDKTPARQVIDLALNAAGLKQVLKGGDIVTLLPISPAFGNAVTLQGVVAEPVRYRWFDGMRVLDLIPDRDALISPDYYKRKNLLTQTEPAVEGRGASKEAGAKIAERFKVTVDQINWDYAVIERLDKTRLTTELIPFNLGKAVSGRDDANNLPLQSGDVVTILSQSDLRLSQEKQTRLVRLEGEVAAPGVYQAVPGETLPQLVKRVGGLTPQAYVYGTEFNRESVRLRQQENLDGLIRKLEAQLQGQAAKTTSNRSADQALQAQELQQAQLRGQVDRLKSFKSNGRLALELDPQAQSLGALPALPLEDGDRILIPPTPGFVSAFGSVHNENALIYKPGKTVADILRSAGLTEDSEPDQAFVLRADGSIVARKDRRGFFGGGFESMLVMPGDTIVVPAQIDRESRYTMITRTFKDWTQILANLGLGVAAINAINK